jgi:putative hydrolase of the HAD superfamily
MDEYNNSLQEQIMDKQNLLFNLDDTLVECNKYFKMVIDQFAKLMVEWFHDHRITVEQVKQKQLELDLTSVAQYGITSKHFPQSFVDTYAYFCASTGRTMDRFLAQQLEQLGRSVYDYAAEPLPNMHETLKQLKQDGHELYLHTAGDEAIQKKKIAQLELSVYFENRIFISRYKNTEALGRIVAEMHFEPSETWMIGNSLRTDIVPGLELGVQVIYIPAPEEWQYNLTEIKLVPRGAFLTLPSLEMVPTAIREYVGQNSSYKIKGGSYT